MKIFSFSLSGSPRACGSFLMAIAAVWLSLGLPSSAWAIPTVDLIWVGTSGTGTTGSSTINALSGDVLTLGIEVSEPVLGTQFAFVGLELALLGSNTVYSGPIGTYLDVECPSPPERL